MCIAGAGSGWEEAAWSGVWAGLGRGGSGCLWSFGVRCGGGPGGGQVWRSGLLPSSERGCGRLRRRRWVPAGVLPRAGSWLQGLSHCWVHSHIKSSVRKQSVKLLDRKQ